MLNVVARKKTHISVAYSNVQDAVLVYLKQQSWAIIKISYTSIVKG